LLVLRIFLEDLIVDWRQAILRVSNGISLSVIIRGMQPSKVCDKRMGRNHLLISNSSSFFEAFQGHQSYKNLNHLILKLISVNPQDFLCFSLVFHSLSIGRDLYKCHENLVVIAYLFFFKWIRQKQSMNRMQLNYLEIIKSCEYCVA